MYCGQCGNEINDTARFCPVCGEPTGISEDSFADSPGTVDDESRDRKNRRSTLVNSSGNEAWTYGTGAKIWLGLCIAFNGVSGIGLLVMLQVFEGLIGIIGAILYIVLWSKKNWNAFYGICVLAVISMLIDFSKGIGVSSLAALVNPVLTFVIVRKYYFLSDEE